MAIQDVRDAVTKYRRQGGSNRPGEAAAPGNPCYSWSAMHFIGPPFHIPYPRPTTCTCGHAGTRHLENVGPCIHQKAWNFCECEHFQPLRMRVPLSGTIPPLPVKNAVFAPWSRQKQGQD